MSSDNFCHLRNPRFIDYDLGAQFVSSEFQNFCCQNGVATSKTTPFHQGNGQNERCNGLVWKAVQCLLHSANLPLSDWECVLPSALSSIRTIIKTVTKECPHDRFFRFKRGSHLQAHTLAQSRHLFLPPPELRKRKRPVVPVQISKVIAPHHARVSFDDGRVDTVSTSDLSRRPSDFGNERKISLPGYQCRGKESNVDPDIGTQCEAPKSVEPVEVSQVIPDLYGTSLLVSDATISISAIMRCKPTSDDLAKSINRFKPESEIGSKIVTHKKNQASASGPR